MSEEQLALPLEPASLGFKVENLTDAGACIVGDFVEQFAGVEALEEACDRSLSCGFFHGADRFNKTETPTRIGGLNVWVLAGYKTSEGLVVWTPDGVVYLTTYGKFAAFLTWGTEKQYRQFVTCMVKDENHYLRRIVEELLTNTHRALLSPLRLPKHWRAS